MCSELVTTRTRSKQSVAAKTRCPASPRLATHDVGRATCDCESWGSPRTIGFRTGGIGGTCRCSSSERRRRTCHIRRRRDCICHVRPHSGVTGTSVSCASIKFLPSLLRCPCPTSTLPCNPKRSPNPARLTAGHTQASLCNRPCPPLSSHILHTHTPPPHYTTHTRSSTT